MARRRDGLAAHDDELGGETRRGEDLAALGLAPLRGTGETAEKGRRVLSRKRKPPASLP
jgi:hypothetical protein